MRPIPLILTLSLAGIAGPGIAQFEAELRHAEMPHFDMVDKDKDGFLSLEEAHVVFNGLNIEDADGDGIVAKGEAEAALPGLIYTNDTHEDFEHRVGPSEYAQMAELFVRGSLTEDGPGAE